MDTNLTDRKAEILALAAAGLTDGEIARTIGLSPWTIKNHLKAVYQELEARNRTHAVVLALMHGIIKLPKRP